MMENEWAEEGVCRGTEKKQKVKTTQRGEFKGSVDYDESGNINADSERAYVIKDDEERF